MWGCKDLISCPQYRAILKGHLRVRTPPIRSLKKVFVVTASQCSNFLCPVLPSYLLTGFVLNVQFNKLPAFPFPSQSLFRKPDLRQIRSFSLQLVMKILSHFGIFHHVIFINQSVNQQVLIPWWYGICKTQKQQNKMENIYDFQIICFSASFQNSL